MFNPCNVAKLIAAVMLLAAALAVSAQDSASGDHVRVRWLAPDSFAAGETETVGFYFEVDPEWHVYWRNAGDSGAAPRFDIAADEAEVGGIQWPFPTRLPIEHLTNLGYHGNVAYLFDVTPADGADSLSLDVNLEWLVCRINCIPGFGSMNLERHVGPSANWSAGDRSLRDRFARRIPAAAAASPWQVVSLSEAGGDRIRLTLEGTGEAPQVFPLDGELLTAKEPALRSDGGRLHYTFERVPGAPRPEGSGFVVSDGERAWQFDDIPFTAAAVAPEAQATSLWWLLLAAFAGGAILNLMPCVFPVLSIKLFGLISARTGTAGRLREGLVYSAGVLVTFAALGGLLLALRTGGAAVGWGFQLQSAPVVLALVLLFWLMALSFSGVFEFGHRLMNLAGHSRGGSFATGVLAVFVAAPCTGPFMGAALGAAAVLPAVSAMAVFLGLGAGLAAPFLLLCASPALLNRLPAPGPWMEKFRQLLAFPLYATVIWLLWVLGRLLGDSGWLIGTLLLLVVVFALWLGRNFARAGRVAGYLLAIAALVSAFGALRVPQTDRQQMAQGEWRPYDRAAIEQARADGRAVFIDYTAAWCITCQVNKKLVLDTPEAMALFAAHDVFLVRADWTSQDPEITRALAELGRNSVPVYAWYAPGATEPELLPQILQQQMIAALFDGLFSGENTLQLTEDERP